MARRRRGWKDSDAEPGGCSPSLKRTSGLMAILLPRSRITWLRTWDLEAEHCTRRTVFSCPTQKKMDRLAGNLGVEVTDELGCVPGDLLHADALRKTYARCFRHDLDSTRYMKPAETWGRMPARILSGDFYQLPPVPASASLLASPLR